ncbi:cell division protein ZapA [Pelagibacterales bacterium SAG-MED15]|nr:cell division protein ZapA [Pelagibacterales bacterium SAG-MED15]|tara:strand:- start:418 stop:864 length:447 start_codon:yes stop_codon:yes gene_type:complete
MANVNIKFNGKEFLLSCDDGQEEHLEELSNVLNNKFNELKTNLGNIGENKLLLITSIKVIDEYFETKKIIESKKKELETLKSKFLDLKNLIYEYKDNKEKEIQTLMHLHDNLKKEVQEVNESYSKIIDDTTKEIDDFVDKINADSSVQ